MWSFVIIFVHGSEWMLGRGRAVVLVWLVAEFFLISAWPPLHTAFSEKCMMWRDLFYLDNIRITGRQANNFCLFVWLLFFFLKVSYTMYFECFYLIA